MTPQTEFNIAYILSDVLNIALDLTSKAYSCADKYGSKGKSGQALSDFRDDLNMSAFIVDNAIIDSVLSILAGFSNAASARILLDSSGIVTIRGDKYKGLTLTSSLEVTTPTLAVIQTMATIEGVASVARDLTDLGTAIGDYSAT
jgi:hypothetical protein